MPVQLIRRVRDRQPLNPTGLSREWVSRGLVLAIAQNWYATPSGIFPLVRTNSPANLPSAKGRVSGFGTTYAGNTNSCLTGPVLKHPKSGWRSCFVLLYAASTGGSGLGRVFQHSTGTGGDGAGGEGMMVVTTTGELRYQKFPSLGSIFFSEYKSPAAIPLNTWTSYGITHEQVVTDTLPQGYKNGVAETWSILTTCGAGSLSASPPTSLAIGNRPSDKARTWDGMIGIQLYFDGALSAADHAAIHANPWQVFAQETIPLFWPMATAKSATASVSAAIRSDRTASASLNAAIQSAATASATLSGAIQTAQSATSGLAAYIVASSARSESAVLSAAISDARTATSSLSAAVAAARTATATLDSAVQIEVTASTGVSAAIREAFSISANLSGAVQASATASASLAAVVAKTNAISSDLSAAVRAEQTAFAALSAYIAADVVLTQAEVDMLTDIWQRFGLDPLAPLTETEAAASFGGIVLNKSGTNTITSTRSGDSAAGIASSMILDVWQRLGLDPDNPMTASETQISAGTLSQARAVSGATVTVTRTP